MVEASRSRAACLRTCRCAALLRCTSIYTREHAPVNPYRLRPIQCSAPSSHCLCSSMAPPQTSQPRSRWLGCASPTPDADPCWGLPWLSTETGSSRRTKILWGAPNHRTENWVEPLLPRADGNRVAGKLGSTPVCRETTIPNPEAVRHGDHINQVYSGTETVPPRAPYGFSLS